jgi:hypothetical protein
MPHGSGVFWSEKTATNKALTRRAVRYLYGDIARRGARVCLPKTRPHVLLLLVFVCVLSLKPARTSLPHGLWFYKKAIFSAKF